MIKVNSAKIIKVNFGNVLKIMDNKSIGYSRFGEAYFSFINYNKIKGWKRHSKMRMNLVVPFGKVQFVFLINIIKNSKKLLLVKQIIKELQLSLVFGLLSKGYQRKQILFLIFQI